MSYKFILILFIILINLISCGFNENSRIQIEQWGMFEATFYGPSGGNPFKEVQLKAVFQHESEKKEVTGFYAGNGVYKIRFMPEEIGQWTYETSSNQPALNGKFGSFTCIEASPGNHGPVQVFNTYHFRYADGTPYKQVGTTCYAWIHQGDSLEEITLNTLKSAPFNKLRMCIFPKDYSFNKNEPIYFPFRRDSLNNNDFNRFDPAFWDHLDKRLLDLLDLGIEADIILFHPYDRWDYATMPDSTDEFYLEYVLARLSAYRHVWWSAANEFDFMYSKDLKDWHRFFEIIYNLDPYQHLRSIHNGAVMYDHTLPWITHASIQSTEFGRADEWRRKYKKPLIFDECRYEGNVTFGWGNLTAEEMTAMFWRSLITGTYAGHGETYLHPQDILWWAKGGELHGQSPERIAFFRKILEKTPETGLEPLDNYSAGKHGEQYIYYFDEESPNRWTFSLPEEIQYQVEVIDTWNMTCDTLDNTYRGKFMIDLPGKKYMALRLSRAGLIFPVKTPDYQPQGALFYDQVKIQLIHPYPATLRYTLDGSDPELESHRYESPILISKNTTLKVLSINNKYESDLLQVDFKEARLEPAVNPKDLHPGLQYAYYTGKWEKMPDFRRLKAVKTGQVSNFDFSMIEQEDYFGMIYSGYIYVPEDGVYTFYASSDDGSFVFVDGNKIIDNDGIHGVVEKSGQIGLHAGYHNFEVHFFDNWYGHALNVEITSKNLTRQRIPTDMLFYSQDK